MLRRMIETSQDWSEKFPLALWAYQTSFHTSTGVTPYSLEPTNVDQLKKYYVWDHGRRIVAIISVSHIPYYSLLTYRPLLAHWVSHVHQSLSFLLPCLHFYTGIGVIWCMHASFRSFVSLGPTGTSFSHYFFYHHITAFHHISLVVLFITFSLFYLLLVLLHILSILSGDPWFVPSSGSGNGTIWFGVRSPATTPFDSCPIGVSADSCPAGAPWLRD